MGLKWRQIQNPATQITKLTLPKETSHSPLRLNCWLYSHYIQRKRTNNWIPSWPSGSIIFVPVNFTKAIYLVNKHVARSEWQLLPSCKRQLWKYNNSSDCKSIFAFDPYILQMNRIRYLQIISQISKSNGMLQSSAIHGKHFWKSIALNILYSGLTSSSALGYKACHAETKWNIPVQRFMAHN